MLGKIKRILMLGKTELWRQGGVRLASSADVALVLLALAVNERIATLVPRCCDLNLHVHFRLEFVWCRRMFCVEGYVLGGGLPKQMRVLLEPTVQFP